jgi:hypothetical protein
MEPPLRSGDERQLYKIKNKNAESVMIITRKKLENRITAALAP